ncbi:N-acetyltransferase [Lacticaseibacillus zhaodongensis]|uniref:N-acetyltransferase n=1 Tax=Lacticaseibacillus zhaodongensis TaxID=2668065 RepID=UPI0012D32AA0|nr:N-acetyltransferase [Lacticaseibacillus zhaodongensis]
MLVNYKDDYKKIAMGFLSYEPDLKDLGNLNTELQLYTNDKTHKLFLYREGDANFSGVVGIECGDTYVLVRHLSLSPAVRGGNTVDKLLDELKKKVSPRKIMGSLENTPLIMKWEERNKEQVDGADPSSK